MIQIIGFMIGSYVIIRMVSFITRSGEYSENVIVIVLAVMEILFIGLCMFLLFTSGMETSNTMP